MPEERLEEEVTVRPMRTTAAAVALGMAAAAGAGCGAVLAAQQGDAGSARLNKVIEAMEDWRAAVAGDPAGDAQPLLFPDDASAAPGPAPRPGAVRRGASAVREDVVREGAESRTPGAALDATTLDRVHAAMLLQASGRSQALRALLKAEQDRGPDFLRRRMRDLGVLEFDPETQGGRRFQTHLHALYVRMESRRTARK